MDWAVLYMRLFAGGMMLFHNIGKMQDYNEIVNSYPSFASAGSAATCVVVTVAEVLLAVAIIMGIWVRMSALILSLGILLMFAWGGFGAGELEFVWLGVYVFLIISGGGEYKNIDSKILLKKTVELIATKGYRVGNIDATICAERPKLKAHIPLMQETMAAVMGIDAEDISIKATTTEKLGFTGREEGISAYATVLIEKD